MLYCEMGVRNMKSRYSRWAGVGAVAVIAGVLMPGLDAVAQDAKKATPKTASVCKGLDEKLCKGRTAECAWIVPRKGKQKAYCRLKPASRSKS
jgi:hypothetical protein